MARAKLDAKTLRWAAGECGKRMAQARRALENLERKFGKMEAAHSREYPRQIGEHERARMLRDSFLAKAREIERAAAAKGK